MLDEPFLEVSLHRVIIHQTGICTAGAILQREFAERLQGSKQVVPVQINVLPAGWSDIHHLTTHESEGAFAMCKRLFPNILSNRGCDSEIKQYQPPKKPTIGNVRGLYVLMDETEGMHDLHTVQQSLFARLLEWQFHWVALLHIKLNRISVADHVEVGLYSNLGTYLESRAYPVAGVLHQKVLKIIETHLRFPFTEVNYIVNCSLFLSEWQLLGDDTRPCFNDLAKGAFGEHCSIEFDSLREVQHTHLH